MKYWKHQQEKALKKLNNNIKIYEKIGRGKKAMETKQRVTELKRRMELADA